ncbi:MAG: M56 family metallopeptidase, partial [Planctomycetes bacterium]|nr:M56 family metallopeptidase [Planctomycetota bacterium]
MPPASIDGGWLREAASTWLPVAADTAVKGAVVLMLVLLVTSLMRRRSAAARHLVWFGALASLAAMPMLSLVLPSWRVLPAWTNVAPIAAGDTLATERPADTVAADVRPVEKPPGEAHIDPAPEANAAASHSAASQPAAPKATAIERPRIATESDEPRHVSSNDLTADAPVVATQAGSANLPWQVWVLIVWAGGTVLALLPLLAGSLSLWRLRRTAERVTDGPLLAMLERTAIATGVDRPVLLLRSDRRTMPMQWGIVHPKLLLPGEADRWSAERLEIVLLHELGHIRRHDCLAHLLAQIACAAHWFNPLAWTALRRMLTERERACDDLTLLAGCRPSRYAEHLLQIASGLQSNVLSAYSSIAVARKSELEGRLLAILDTTARRRRLTRTAAAL